MSGTTRQHRAGSIALLGLACWSAGCSAIPVRGLIETRTAFSGATSVDGKIAATVEGPIKVELASATDAGPMVAVVARAGRSDMRVGVVDVDGLILNQNLAGVYSVGENPVAAFREKLETAAADPALRAVVVRINSPGGSVTGSDILSEELRRFRQATGKPVVCCMMDLATSGAYYLAVGGDRIVAHPTTVTGGLGALINHHNLQDASAQLNARSGAVKSGEKVEMGSYNGPLTDADAQLLQEMVDGFRDRFRERIAQHRGAMTAEDFAAIEDGRVMAADKALKLHMIDRVGYLHDAIDEAEKLARAEACEVVVYQRRSHPSPSVYAISPAPVDGGIIPFSLPGLDRAKLPTFLYLWQPDPTMLRLGGR